MKLTRKIFQIYVVSCGALFICNTQADVPNVFVSGSPAVAAEVNENFDNLDQRLTAIEQGTGGSEVAIDCSGDVNALINTDLKNGNTYVLTGMCNGPIGVFGNKSVTFKGDATGTKDDGVILPAGLTQHPEAAIAVYGPNQVFLENLTVSSENYVSTSYSFGSYVATLNAGNGARAYVTNVDFIGGDYSVQAFRNGVININDGVSVTGFNIGGLNASHNGHIQVRKPITVTGLTTSTNAEYTQALSANKNASLDIVDGGTFTAPTGGSTILSANAIECSEGGVVRVRNSGTSIFNGNISAYRSAVVRVQAGSVNGNVGAGDLSNVTLENVTLNPSNPISLIRFSILKVSGSTDLNGVNVECHDTHQYSDSTTSGANAGAICP